MGYDAASVYATGASVSATALETWSATARGTKLSFATVPLTASALTTKMEIGPDGLITGVGPSLGAWTAYTPTISGTGWALGNGNVTDSRYMQIGKMVYVSVKVLFGTTSTYGSAALRISYPVTAKTNEFSFMTGIAVIGANQYPIQAHVEQANGNIKIRHAASTLADVISTVPATWVNGSTIYFNGVYEAA